MMPFHPMMRAGLIGACTTFALATGAGAQPAPAGASTAPGQTQALPQMNVDPPPSPGAGGLQMPSVSAGLLECRGDFATATGFGSSRKVRCEFRPSMGQNHYYIGTLERTGLDIGVSDQGSMLWGVFATSPNIDRGALAGTYVGFTSGFALGPGFSANILAAKDATRQITLQPLSISSDSGLSLSIASATLTLEPSTALIAGDPPPSRR
ncbi:MULTISPECIES: DUF992 domain-containing protein [unclassified Xanthobacter]|uniref:DUF992 domain-containing protein n=1 Tax=unclassified Xanthobacter TaxID=2623496 RepID=UPI001EE03298|nr:MULTISPECIES: DUF992 domain-containing protein [unclassified Xanthobacter]